MRYHFEDSCNMNILSWKLYRNINSIRTWSSWREEFTSFLPLKFEYSSYLFPIQRFSCTFYDLQSTAFKCFTKIMRESCVFCCSSLLVLTLQSTLIKMIHKQLCKQYIKSKLTNKYKTVSFSYNLFFYLIISQKHY